MTFFTIHFNIRGLEPIHDGEPLVSFFLLHVLTALLSHGLSNLCHKNFTKNDELALLALKISVRDPFNHLANWSSSFSICNWVGVTCDSKGERVSVLNLAHMSLMGTLPSQVGNLSSLVELALHSNNFHGELPKELLQLHKLRILNLSYNEFDGKIPAGLEVYLLFNA
ncbi:tyrosine-sulfated glycopeptide receptor 1-like [Prosopis cineraria]|uniref:tyrosine-sulfated glycopeptide receptor 1-like n=1 Tax=Prosopis cineraria TaxID=364024 RepID=UPI00240ED8AB|nr:tyrosine-sulfated glycopeptide receptor 1-like [Prosopis cineraria]